MPKCQVYGCPNQPGACNSIDGKKRSFFMIPDGLKNPQLCSIWIKSLGPTKYSSETFRSNKCRTVCEEHFTTDCFQEDKYAKLLGYIPNRKLLIPGACPTLVGEKAYASRLKRLHAKERRRKELEAKQMATTCHSVCGMESCQEDCNCCWTEVNELPVLLKETQVTGVIEDHNYCFPRKIEPEDAYRRIEVGLTEEQLRQNKQAGGQVRRVDAHLQGGSRHFKSTGVISAMTGGVVFPVGLETANDSGVVESEEITIEIERLPVEVSTLHEPFSALSYPVIEPNLGLVDRGATRHGQNSPLTVKKEPDNEVVVKLEVFESDSNSDETVLEFKVSVDEDESTARV